MPKKIITKAEALASILKGVNTIGNIVKATMGPNGRNTVYERVPDNVVLSTRDGVTVARQIELEDPFENMGAQMVRGVANEQVHECGDGTTASTLLTQAIFAEGVKAVTVGANPVALKRGIEKAVTAVLAEVKKNSVPVEGKMSLQVAMISANNDSTLGNLIQSAIDKAGKDGVVVCEESRTVDSSLELMEGVQFASGWIASEFVTDASRQECVLENVRVLLYEARLTTLLPMLPLLKEIRERGEGFIVIAEDVVDEALSILRLNAAPPPPPTGQTLVPFKCCAVKSPGGLEHLKDLAALTGATVITGGKVADITLAQLGHIKKVVVKSNNTTIMTETKSNPALTKRIHELRGQVTSAANPFDSERLQARLARLSGGVAIIRIGAATVLEMSEKKDRLEDALHATRAAIAEGVVPGGGVALARCSSVIDSLNLEGDEKTGGQIVKLACMEPLKTIARNSGESEELVLRLVLSKKPFNYGWNARSAKYGNLIHMGVIDPAKVVRMALQSAASVAGLMLITEALVSNPRGEQ